jgi:nucleoside-diphosphate-sugar epimerase
MATALGSCLVIGGGGWTGSYIVNQLLQQAQEYDRSIVVHVMDIMVPTSRKELSQLHEHIASPDGFVSVRNCIVYHQCDITNSDEFIAKIEEINPVCVFHTVSIVDLRKFPSPLLERINIHGTFNVLKGLYSLLKNDAKSERYLVYTSSIDVVADKYGVTLASEETPFTEYPSNHYKGSKIVAETEVLRGNGDFCGRLRTCCLRPSHIFGAGR